MWMAAQRTCQSCGQPGRADRDVVYPHAGLALCAPPGPACTAQCLAGHGYRCMRCAAAKRSRAVCARCGALGAFRLDEAAAVPPAAPVPRCDRCARLGALERGKVPSPYIRAERALSPGEVAAFFAAQLGGGGAVDLWLVPQGPRCVLLFVSAGRHALCA